MAGCNRGVGQRKGLYIYNNFKVAVLASASSASGNTYQE